MIAHRRARAALAVVASVTTTAAVARADQTITPDSVAGQNVRTAEAFIRETGNTALADDIEAFLVNGRFAKGDLGDKHGSTSAFNDITLDDTVVSPITAPIDRKNAFESLLILAATLAHEEKHAHQTVGDKINGWWKEYDAWTTEIFELDSWIKYLRAQYKNAPTNETLEQLRAAVGLKLETLKEFTETEGCFGYPCDAFESMHDTMKDVAVRLEAAKPGRYEDQKAVKLIESVDKLEASAQKNPPAKGSDPPSPPEGKKPPPSGTPTHRVAACGACAPKADQLNIAADGLANAIDAAPDERAGLLANVKKLTADLDECEKAECTKSSRGEVGMTAPVHHAPRVGEDPRVAIGVRAGVAAPLGSAAAGSALSDGVSVGIPFALHAGYGFGGGFMIGAYFGFGPVLEKNCPDGASCSGWNMRTGAVAEYRVQATPQLFPWGGVGTGIEVLHGSSSAGGVDTSSSLFGLELATLQGGADFVVADRVTVGPLLMFSFGEYLTSSASVNGSSKSSSIDDKRFHEWITLGVRGSYDMPLQ